MPLSLAKVVDAPWHSSSMQPRRAARRKLLQQSIGAFEISVVKDKLVGVVAESASNI